MVVPLFRGRCSRILLDKTRRAYPHGVRGVVFWSYPLALVVVPLSWGCWLSVVCGMYRIKNEVSLRQLLGLVLVFFVVRDRRMGMPTTKTWATYTTQPGTSTLGGGCSPSRVGVEPMDQGPVYEKNSHHQQNQRIVTDCRRTNSFPLLLSPTPKKEHQISFPW